MATPAERVGIAGGVNARSWLFAPGDSERKLAKSVAIGADAIILDLEDAVAPEDKPAARESARVFLQSRGRAARTQLWVRINPLNTPDASLDLAAIMAARPDGLMIPKIDHPSELVRLGGQEPLDQELSPVGRRPVSK